eukprot:Nk52_evm17s287 gene=Nk52_evmTU17s287
MRGVVLVWDKRKKQWSVDVDDHCVMPEAGSYDLIVEVKACSLNFLPPQMEYIDSASVSDQYRPRCHQSSSSAGAGGNAEQDRFVLGTEISGIVVKRGDGVRGFEISDEVAAILPFMMDAEKPLDLRKMRGVADANGLEMGISEFSTDHIDAAEDIVSPLLSDENCIVGGGLAEYCKVRYFEAFKKPPALSHALVAASMFAGLRAYTAFCVKYRVVPGDSVLVLDALSVCNFAIVQLLSRWHAKLIVTVENSQQAKELRSKEGLHISRIIDVSREDLGDVCFYETGGLGLDCVIDSGKLHENKKARLHDEDLVPKDEGEKENNGGDTLAQTEDSFIEDICSGKSPYRITKYRILNVLAVNGTWITSLDNLQLDPPDSSILHLKCASIVYLNERSWVCSGSQMGRYHHIMRRVMNDLEDEVIVPEKPKLFSFEDMLNSDALPLIFPVKGGLTPVTEVHSEQKTCEGELARTPMVFLT